MKPYQKFAFVYDQMKADEHSVKMAEYCTKIFRKFKINPTTGLDICCGTGSAIERFVNKGIIMSGLDQSASMLAVAAKKLKNNKLVLYQKSLPKFRILGRNNKHKIRKFDLITCFYDSLNYLKNQTELETAFKSVYIHLQRGGWFIFDMNTPPALKIIWGESVFAGVKDNLAWIWKNDYSDKTTSATLHTTFFKKRGKLWERFDEVHIERAYDNKIILSKLRKTGFKIKGFYRCYSFDKPGTKTYRICAVVRKPL
ncbi:MAG: class I SAM-dependent DNA methyltransferase [Candidatus Zixiibacteriota bacterium]